MKPTYSKTALMSELIDAVGEDGFVTLAQEFGGVRVYVPREPTGPLLSALGLPAATKLSECRGGEYISVPAAKKMRIAVYRSRGWSPSKIARAVGLSEKSIYRHFERARNEG